VTAADERPAICVEDAAGSRIVALEDLLDPAAAEQSEADANQWIKALRHAHIEGVAFRDRFLHRGDSLWWFAELYLHKTRAIATAHATLRALEAAVAQSRPHRIAFVRGSADIHDAAAAFCAAHRIAFDDPAPSRGAATARFSVGDMRWQARLHMTSAALRHARRRSPAVPARIDVASFVHSAFWRDETADETYVGPVLRAVAERVPAERRFLVGLGPRTNFKARGWRARLRELGDPIGITPVEMFASWAALDQARAVWTARVPIRRALESSDELRARAIVRGCDLWPIVRRELAGLAYLQFPWSAVAMDEAAAALDVLKPRVAFTYAEAGGWGRALALESRRRGIPLVALQHGFIYRHWLNYLHEPDEVRASDRNPLDAGFPRPALTLLHDEFAARHLEVAGSFPRSALRVVGSARLDALVRSARAAGEEGRLTMRMRFSVGRSDSLVVVAAKFTQIRGVFPELVAIVREMPGVRLVVKCHPAETPEPYERAAAGAANVTVAPADVDLGALIAASKLLITVNSTAAIEAMVLDVPALVLALPNNLSPFVDAGVMAGVRSRGGLRAALETLLYDEDRRAELGRRRTAFLKANRIESDGRAAQRAADAIVELAR
jgi:hypothetical protein